MNEDEEIEAGGISQVQNSLVPAKSQTRSHRSPKVARKEVNLKREDQDKYESRIKICVTQEVNQMLEDTSRNHSSIVRQINDSGRNAGLNHS